MPSGLTGNKQKATKQADAARKAIEEKAVADQAQWKELAEKRAADLTALQAKAGEPARQGAVIEQLYETRLAGLSAPIRKAVESLPVDDMLARLGLAGQQRGAFQGVLDGARHQRHIGRQAGGAWSGRPGRSAVGGEVT